MAELNATGKAGRKKNSGTLDNALGESPEGGGGFMKSVEKFFFGDDSLSGAKMDVSGPAAGAADGTGAFAAVQHRRDLDDALEMIDNPNAGMRSQDGVNRTKGKRKEF